MTGWPGARPGISKFRCIELESAAMHAPSFTVLRVEIRNAFSLPVPADCIPENQKAALDRKTISKVTIAKNKEAACQ